MAEFGHRLRVLFRNIHADLGHYQDGPRMDRMPGEAGRVRLNHVSLKLSDPAFGHLAAAGVAGAKEQNFDFAHCRTTTSTQLVVRVKAM
jgi:hypothetical protein